MKHVPSSTINTLLQQKSMQMNNILAEQQTTILQEQLSSQQSQVRKTYSYDFHSFENCELNNEIS